MTWLTKLETNLEVVLSRWFLEPSAPTPRAFANPWWPGVGPWWIGEHPNRVEEPPFSKFDLKPLRSDAPGAEGEANPASAQRPPATLTELGLPAELAHDLEVTFRAMGATDGGQVIGFRFRSLDGDTQSIRLGEAA